MIPISKPMLGDEEIAAVTAVLRSGNLVQGSSVTAFETALQSYLGVSHTIAVSSGTAALQLALEAVGIKEGDEVITTPLSFAATTNAILSRRAMPVFADIDPRTFNLDPKKVEASITDKTRAILAVHLFGHPCDLDALQQICTRHDLLLIEDCAQSLGGTYKRKQTGTKGIVSCFSFYPSKNITTGEGGLIATSEESIADICRTLRNQGQRKPYEHHRLGFNFRMTEIAAAIGKVQLSRLPDWLKQRKANAEQLTKGLQQRTGITVPFVSPESEHAWHQYTIRVSEDRDKIQERLKGEGVDARVYYPRVLYDQPVYKQWMISGSCPIAERATKEVLSLPVHPQLCADDLDTVITAVQRVIV
ncbi:MAG: DegT/DnrJ/EryC1/StrS family aminotransferase [Nanoarchaeota archaeon]|nr:DegT/DnrJ/EryC1/StrS family aminotransferase [Nanoarchaeota archaeon]